jgi:hypothetical protein
MSQQEELDHKQNSSGHLSTRSTSVMAIKEISKMASKEGCILVEKVGYGAPLELIQKIISNNPTCGGVAMSFDGSPSIATQAFVELYTAEEWVATRSAMKESLCVSWWGSCKAGFETAEIQPAILLAFEDGQPALVAFTEGSFSRYAKPKTPLGEVHYFNDELRTMVQELNSPKEHNGDISKVLAACEGSLFKKWYNTATDGRAYTLLLAGQLRSTILTQGNDKGLVEEWGEVSNAYGYRNKAAPDPKLQGPAARLAAMAGGYRPPASGQSEKVVAQTSTEKLMLAAKGVLTGVPPQAPAPDTKEEPKEETTEGTVYPPDIYITAWQKAKNKEEKGTAQQVIYEWYREHNGGVAPSGFKHFLSHAKGGSDLPGVKAGQEPWKPGDADTRSQGSKRDHKAALHNIGAGSTPTSTSNITRASSTQTAALEAVASEGYSDERKMAIVEKVLTKDSFMDTLSFDDTKIITLEEIAKLDGPKADPFIIFGEAGVKDHDSLRAGREDLLLLDSTDPAFFVDLYLDARKKYLNLKIQRPALVTPPVSQEDEKVLIGPAAKMRALFPTLKRA